MYKISLKERLKKGESVLGTWNIIASAAVVEAIGYAGLDFVVIDAEHGPISMETAQELVRSAEASGVSAIIRVSTNEPYLILRALDIGACGVQVPHVSTKREAIRVVESAKYYPLGKRGLSPLTRAGKYGMRENHVSCSNENTLVVINVEGVEGIRNLEDIATVKHIDVVFIGSYDLSQSIGKPGQIKDSRVIDEVKKSVDILDSRGIACGCFANDIEHLEILIDCGVRYLTYMVDSALISKTYKDLGKFFKKHKKD